MSHKIISALLIGTLLLASCGTTKPEVVVKDTKKPFLVDTKLAKDFTKDYTIEKSGRLVGTSTIALASQGVGRVTSVAVKEGASVKKGQILVFLSDTTANYDIRLEQARNALRNAEVNIESTKLQLDKTIADTKFALEKTKSDYFSITEDAVKKLEKARRDSAKAIVSSTGSDAQAALEKSELDYTNLQNTNDQTIKNLDATYRLSYNDLKKLMAKMLYQGDKAFGLTDKFRNDTVTNKQYMGVRNSATRTALEQAYTYLVRENTNLEQAASIQIDESSALIEIEKLGTYYPIIRTYILAASDYIENSISSSSFPQSVIDAYTTEYLGYKTELSSIETGYTSFKNTTSSFLSSYKNNEASVAAGLEVQKMNLSTGEFESALGLERIQIGINRDITQAQIAVDSAESNYTNAVANKDITIKKLAVSLADAQLSLEQANKEFAKLSIVSPIDATVTRVSVSVGQEIAAGVPVIEIASRNPEIIFDLDSDAVVLLKVGSTQPVIYDGKTYTGIVVGVSQVANESLLYTARITLSESPKFLGGVATIQLSLKSEYPMFPNEMVRIISEEQGEISIYSGSTITSMSVKIGAVVNRSIQIISPLSSELEIITSDVSNFDEKKNIIEKRKTLE